MHLNIERIYRQYLSLPLLFLLVCVLSNGLLIPWLGYLQDDWYIAWHIHAFGPSVFHTYFSWERPGLAGIYQLTTSLLGTSAVTWHVSVVLCLWLATVIFWIFLRAVWPGRLRQVTWMALLFAIYPGFRSLHFAVMHTNDLLVLAVHILSFYLMIQAVRRRRWYIPLTILSMGFVMFSLFSMEYYFGWELLRPVFLWFILAPRKPEARLARLKSVLLNWLPYLAVTMTFLFWRVFIFKFPTKYQPVLFNEALVSPFVTALKIAGIVIRDFLETNLFAWDRTLSLLKLDTAAGTSTWLALAVAVIGAGLVALWLLADERKTTKTAVDSDNEDDPHFTISTLVIGLCSAIICGWPFWFVGLAVNGDIGPDRFTMPFMMGVSILIVGVLDWLVKTRNQKIVLVSILVGLAAALHFQDANALRRVHESQASLFRQIVWRIPALKTGALLVTDRIPILYSSDTSLTAPLNWIYSQEAPYPMRFAMLELESRYGNVIPGLEPDLPVNFGYRATGLSSSTNNMLLFRYSPPGCFQVVDASSGKLAINPPLIVDAAPLSNMQMIDLETQLSPEFIDELFGPEPRADWCYYYEKADLARQKHQWQDIVDLGERAAELGFAPAEPLEVLPFVAGYLHTDRLEKARRLTLEAWKKEPSLQPILCQTWQQAVKDGYIGKPQLVPWKEVTNQIDCKFE